MGFTKSEVNPNLYYIFVGTDLLVLVLYVDDSFLTSAEKLLVGVFRLRLGTQFSRQEEHLKVLFYFELNNDIIFHQEVAMALRLAEAKYMVASSTSCEAIWLHKLLARPFDQELDPIIIYCDNQRGIKP
jgi:hypothetical protein